MCSLSEQIELPFPQPNKIFVAFSGGKDSSVLLHKAVQQFQLLDVEIVALHINHQLNINANQWEAHCKDFCESIGVTFYSQKITLSQATRKGLERRAREARLDAFSNILPKQAILALAHHQQDQAETIFLKLLRGGGLNALKGMSNLTPYKHFFLWRPMLSISQEEITKYAEKNRLTWVEDDSNTDVSLSRNYLRHKIFPKLEQKWPKTIKRLSNSVQQINRETIVLTRFLQQEIQNHILEPRPFAKQSLSLESLNLLPESTRFLLLKQWLSEHQIQLLQPFLHEILRQLKDARCGEFVVGRDEELKHPTEVLFFQKGVLSLYDSVDKISAVEPLYQPKKNGEQDDWLLHNPLSIRTRTGGEIITINGHPQRLKSWYKKQMLPRSWRKLPLLYAGDKLIGVLGLILFDFPSSNKEVEIRWVKTDKSTV
jgi:tRNA(Ile)-lysidine synthase